MSYAFRLDLVHFLRLDPNGIRRDPRRDPIQDPTGSAVVRYHELCFSLGFGAFFATGS